MAEPPPPPPPPSPGGATSAGSPASTAATLPPPDPETVQLPDIDERGSRIAFVLGVATVVLVLVAATVLVLGRWGDSTAGDDAAPAVDDQPGRLAEPPPAEPPDDDAQPAAEPVAEDPASDETEAAPDASPADDGTASESDSTSQDDATDTDADTDTEDAALDPDPDPAAVDGSDGAETDTVEPIESESAPAEATDPAPDDTDSLGDSATGPSESAADDAEVADADAIDDANDAGSSDDADEPAIASGEPQSRAVFRDGVVVLEGAVPTDEISAEIEALAAEILGPDNVVNNYVIDPSVPAPTTGNLVVEETIEFAPGSFWLREPVPALMVQGLALMNARPTTSITIVGHTDSIGSEDDNRVLSLARAESVKDWFVDNGIDPDRLTTRGAGESQPIADNGTEEGRRQNRRIQFVVENILGTG